MKKILLILLIIGLITGLFVSCIPSVPPTPSEVEGEEEEVEPTTFRVVLVELFNTQGCPACTQINPIVEEVAQEYDKSQVILIEEATWGLYSTPETSERYRWYLPESKERKTPNILFNGLNHRMHPGGSGGGGGGNQGNQGNSGDTGTGEVDTTKPVITASRAPLPNSFDWNNTDVTVSFSCADTGPVQSGIDVNTVAGKTVTTEGKDQSVTNTGTCVDMAGNIADPVTVSNINIDKTPPVVMITLPGTGEYVLNQSITATWSAIDALSGVVSPVSGFVSIDTSSVGTKTLTLPAGKVKDKAGNSSLEVTKSYSVIEKAEEPIKWSGLGMNIVSPYDTSEFDGYVDTLLANGFTELRIFMNYFNTGDDETYNDRCKAAAIRAIAKGAEIIFGVTAGGDHTITSANWATIKTGIENAATWAQANGIYEFQIGNEEELHNDDDTLTDAQLIVNLKSVATDVQAIFTNGDVSYSCYNDFIGNWVTAGKGDLDLLASNIYMTWDIGNPCVWKDQVDALVAGFGINGTYLTEFSLNTINIDYYSADEAVQATAVTEMIKYIKDLGIERAYFYEWKGDDFGVVKNDGTYRLLWNQALLNSESVKFATVPTTTTTISLLDTIALLLK